MYYTNSNDDEDGEFNTLNQGLALIARAFSKFSNKTNNRLRTHLTQIIKMLFKMVELRYEIATLEDLVQVVIWEI